MYSNTFIKCPCPDGRTVVSHKTLVPPYTTACFVSEDHSTNRYRVYSLTLPFFFLRLSGWGFCITWGLPNSEVVNIYCEQVSTVSLETSSVLCPNTVNGLDGWGSIPEWSQLFVFATKLRWLWVFPTLTSNRLPEGEANTAPSCSTNANAWSYTFFLKLRLYMTGCQNEKVKSKVHTRTGHEGP